VVAVVAVETKKEGREGEIVESRREGRKKGGGRRSRETRLTWMFLRW